MLNEEKHLKMQSQAVSVLTSFIKGLIDEESAEDSETNVKNKKVLLPYADDIVLTISNLLNTAV
jgi:hypothetical protein